MSWLLELLVDAIREMCSQFIVDMMELITNMFTELLSCNLSLFEELFSVVGSLYKNVIVPTGIAILLMILIWQLFKSMFGGKAGVNAEEPIELICRSAISLFLLAGSKPLIDYILRIAGTPYQWVVGTKVKVASFSGYVSTLEGVTDTLGISSLSISVLMLIMQFVVAWNYFKMLMVIAERYVLLGVFSYTAPLAFATGGSKATNNILASWSKGILDEVGTSPVIGFDTATRAGMNYNENSMPTGMESMSEKGIQSDGIMDTGEDLDEETDEADFYAKSAMGILADTAGNPLKAENTKLSDPGMQNEDDIQPTADETGMTADGFMNVSGSIPTGDISLKRSRPDTRRIREVPKSRAELKEKGSDRLR